MRDDDEVGSIRLLSGELQLVSGYINGSETVRLTRRQRIPALR